MKAKFSVGIFGLLLAAFFLMPTASTHAYSEIGSGHAEAAAFGPALYSSMFQTSTLTIALDTSALFSGAQTMIDALSTPYMLIAGFGLGVAILGAIMAAVTKLRLN